MNADAGLAQIVELESVSECAVGERGGRRADPRQTPDLRPCSLPLPSDMARKTLRRFCSTAGAAEQRNRDRIDQAGFGDRNHGRRNVLVTQRRRKFRERLRFASHDYAHPRYRVLSCEASGRLLRNCSRSISLRSSSVLRRCARASFSARSPSRASIACNKPAMLLERFGRPALAVKRAGLNLPDMIEQRIQRLQQTIVVRGAADQLMKFAGQPPQGVNVAAAANCFHVLQQFANFEISDGVAFSAASRAAMPSSASRT